MDCLERMRRIRLIEKMDDSPVMSKKLGLKDRSYVKMDRNGAVTLSDRAQRS